jgi:DNA-binding transcriptional LysR family regulator
VSINVDLTSLRYFLHVAAAGSFVGGAARAHVSPPAVSKAIRKLETDLDAKLFERTTRRVVLTQAGQVALHHARGVLQGVDELGADLAGAASTPRGPLRVAAMEVFSADLLPRALSALVAKHPAVIPQCYEMIPQRMTELLVAGELDIAFTIGATAMPGIELHALGVSRGALVCGKRHPLYATRKVTSKDLLRYPSVVPKFLGAEHLPSLDAFPEERAPRLVGATIELLQMGIGLVLHGQYMGFFPEICVRHHLKDGSLRALRGAPVGAPFKLQALTRAGVSQKPATTLLINEVKRTVKARS